MGRKCAAALAAATLFAVLLSSVRPLFLWKAGAADTPEVAAGPMERYSAILFDYFESVHGYSEGPMAVGGQSRFGSSSGQYDVGASPWNGWVGSYDNPWGYPSLLLGEVPQVGTPYHASANVHGGPVVLDQELRSAYEALPFRFQIRDGFGTVYAPGGAVRSFFDHAYNRAKRTEAVLGNAFTEAKLGEASLVLRDFVGWNTTPGVFNDLSRFQPDNLEIPAGKRILVIPVSDRNHVEINGPQLTASLGSYDLVILHFPNATSARFTGATCYVDGTQLNPYALRGTAENQLLRQYGERIVWSFPNAGAVQIAGTGIVGSLLAPDAYVEGSGGTVNGIVAAQSLYEGGGFWINAFYPDGSLFQLENREEGEPLEGSVRILKYNSNPLQGGGSLLSGAQFDLYQMNGAGIYSRYNRMPYVTGTAGTAVIRGLPEGQYLLMEREPPYGFFSRGQRHYFTIDAGHGVSRPLIFPIPNTRIRTEITLRKVDADDPGRGLAGARFLLYRIQGGAIEIQGEYSSDSGGYIHLPQLAYGSYRLFEVVPPSGYQSVINEYVDVRVTGDTHGNAEIRYENSRGEEVVAEADGVIHLKNRVLEGAAQNRVVVTKVDADDPDTPLDDTIFSLFYREEESGEWELLHSDLDTNEYGLLVIEGLEDGFYRLVETEPSIGYRAVEDSYEFSFGRELTRPENTAFLTIANKAIGRILVEKYDSTDPGKKLSGAEFSLYYDAGSLDVGEGTAQLEEVASGETDESGLLSFESLKPGRYYLVQTKSPEGYLPIESPELVGDTVVGYIVNQEGERVFYPEESSLEVSSAPDMGSVVIYKTRTDSTGGESLSGAVFDLYAYSREDHRWQPYRQGLTTSPDREGLLVESLPSGNYKLVEVRAPSGYVLDTADGANEVIFSVEALTEPQILSIGNRPAPSTTPPAAGGFTSRKYHDSPVREDIPGPDGTNPDTGKPGNSFPAVAIPILLLSFALRFCRRGRAPRLPD